MRTHQVDKLCKMGLFVQNWPGPAVCDSAASREKRCGAAPLRFLIKNRRATPGGTSTLAWRKPQRGGQILRPDRALLRLDEKQVASQ